MKKIYTVSEITRVIKRKIQSLGSVCVEGEISNLSQSIRRHCYFTLKDKSSQIKCAIFANVASKVHPMPKDGDKVRVYGALNVYEARGYHQIIVKRIEPVGAGKLMLELERLKNQLREEGLFDDAFKKKLPAFPEKIAVVTSPTGAAVRDIIDVIGRRYPFVEIVFFPVLVQGTRAAGQIVNAVELANQIGDFDLMIVGRGGGSIEDLWAFNEETVVRSIFNSEIPVISAVGHETDFMLSDFVADLRAPTPSAAAELAVQDKIELKRKIDQSRRRLTALVKDKIDRERKRYETAEKGLAADRRLDEVRQLQQTTDRLTGQLHAAATRVIENRSHRFKLCVEKLNQLSPLATLSRGYSICYDTDRHVIRSVSQVEAGDEINVKVADGQIVCEVVN